MGAQTPSDPGGFASSHEHQRRGRDAGRVLVLNATYEPINVCTVRRAAVLLLKTKAEVVEQSGETLRRAGRLQSDLQYGRIDEILATGLHAFLTQFLERVGGIGLGISRDFLVPAEA